MTVKTLQGFRSLLNQAAALEEANGYEPGTGPVVVTSGGLRQLIARLEASERVVEAVKAAGPFPMVMATAGERCLHCSQDSETEGHHPSCTGVALRDALATHAAERGGGV